MANPPRRFSAPETTSAVIGDFHEPYGAVFLPAPVSSVDEDISDKEEMQPSRPIRNGRWIREREGRRAKVSVVQREMAIAIYPTRLMTIGVLDGFFFFLVCDF